MRGRASDLALRAAPALAPAVVRALYAHCSVRVLNREVQRRYVDGGRAFVGVVWHQDFLFALDYFRGRRIAVMVSRSRDGELAARALGRLGYRTVRGSSTEGGREALRELTALVREGWGAALVADGPRGPARQAKIGCVVAARNSGAPLIPFGCAVRPSVRNRSWDRTVLPLPGARIVAAFGDPIGVPPDAPPEECERLRRLVDRRMEDLEATCARAAEGRTTSPTPPGGPIGWAPETGGPRRPASVRGG